MEIKNLNYLVNQIVCKNAAGIWCIYLESLNKYYVVDRYLWPYLEKFVKNPRII